MVNRTLQAVIRALDCIARVMTLKQWNDIKQNLDFSKMITAPVLSMA